MLVLFKLVLLCCVIYAPLNILISSFVLVCLPAQLVREAIDNKKEDFLPVVIVAETVEQCAR